MPRFRLLALIAALCLVATACPVSDTETANQEPSAGDGDANGDDTDPPDEDAPEDEPGDDEPDPGEDDLEDEPDPEDDDLDEGDVDEEDTLDEEDAEENASEDCLPARCEPLRIPTGGPYLDDPILDAEFTVMIGDDGQATFTGPPEMRTDAWHGFVFFVMLEDGTEAEVQCSSRPDLDNVDPVCFAFVLPDFGCGGQDPFDPGTDGDYVVPSPFFTDDSGQLVYLPGEVPEGCTDMTGAIPTGGYGGRCDSAGACNSLMFGDGFESGDTSAWVATTP